MSRDSHMTCVTRHNTVPRGLRVCNIAPSLVITYVPGLALREGKEEEGGVAEERVLLLGCDPVLVLNSVRRVLLVSIWPLPPPASQTRKVFSSFDGIY